MKKLFDWGYVKNTLKKLVVISVIIIVCALIIALLRDLLNFSENYSIRSHFRYLFLLPVFYITSIIGSVFMAARAFSFTRNKKMADFVYSLPISRKQIFLSSVLAIVMMQLFTLIIISVFSIFLAYTHFGIMADISGILYYALFFFNISFVIIGAYSVAAGLAGRAFPQIIITFGIVAAPALWQFTRHMILRAKDYNIYAIIYKNPLYSITNLFYLSDGKVHMSAIVFTFLLTFAYFALGCYVYSKRTAQSSGLFANSKWVHQLVKCIIGFVMVEIAVHTAMGRGILYRSVSEDSLIEFALILLVGLVAIYTYDLYVYRGYMKKNRNLIIFPILIGAVLLLNFAVNKKVEIEHNMQIDADKVEHINIIRNNEVYPAYGSVHDFNETYGVYISSITDIDNELLIDEVVNTVNSAEDKLYEIERADYAYLLIKFTYKSGRRIYKYVPIYQEAEERFLEGDGLLTRLVKEPNYYDTLMQMMPIENILFIDFSNPEGFLEDFDEKLEVYKTLMSEYGALPDEQKQVVKTYSYSPYEDVLYGVINVGGKCGQTTLIDTYYITDYTPKATNAYMQYINSTNAIDFDNLISELENHPSIFNYEFRFGRKTIKATNKDEHMNKMIYLLKKYEYEQPDIEGNVLRIRANVYSTVFVCVDDKMMDELKDIWLEQQKSLNES